MKNGFNRVLSTSLVLIMLFSLAPVHAIASEQYPDDERMFELPNEEDLQLDDIGNSIDDVGSLNENEDDIGNSLEDIVFFDGNEPNEDTLYYTDSSECTPPIYGSPEYDLWKQQFSQSDNDGFPLIRGSNFLPTGLPRTVGNDFLEYYVNSNGSYSIGTTGGNTNLSTDNYKKMIYGHPGGTTSNATINIDGINTEIVSRIAEYNEETKTLITTQNINGVEVKQILSLFPNPISEIEDTVRIEFQITNNTTTSKSIGFRTMWDTCLGDYDNAPFRVAGIGAITRELELTGNAIPNSWLVIDNLSNPGIITQGYPRNVEGLPQPDRLQFVSWSNVSSISSAWNYIPEPERNIGDSAVCIYWDPRTVGAGDELRCVAYYGIGSFVQSTVGNMNIGADPGVYQLKRQPNGGYSPNVFTTTAFIENGYSSVTNLNVTLDLPSGLSLATGYPQTITIPSLSGGDTRSDLAWQIEVNQRAFFPFDIPINMILKITADGITERSIFLPITIPVMDVSAPHAPINLSSIPGRRSIALEWDNPEDYGLFDVVAYNIYRNEELVAMLTWEDGVQPITTFTDYGQAGSITSPNLGRNSAYQYKVVAYNFQQQPSIPANITTTTLDIDDEPPTKPGAPTIASLSSLSATIRWGASSDETELGGYKIFNDGTLEKTVGSTITETTVTGLSTGTEYTFAVQAFDTSTYVSGGNLSEMSNSVVVTPILPSFSSSTAPQTEYILEAKQNIALYAVVTDSNNLAGMTGAVQYRVSGTLAWTTINEWASIPANRQLSYQWAYYNYLAAGDYQLRYLLIDRDGGTEEVIYGFTTKHDDILPTVSINRPSNAIVLSGRDLILSGNSSDNIEVDRVLLSFSIDGGSNYIEITTLINEKTTGRNTFAWQYTFDATALPSGAIRIKATAVDGRDNTADAIVSFELDNTPPDTPYGFSISNTGEYIELLWAYPTQSADSDFSSFRVYRAESATGPFEIVRTLVTRGYRDDAGSGIQADTTYFYYITAVDLRGNESDSTAVLPGRMEEDTVPPVIVSYLPRQNTELCKEVKISVSLYDNYKLRQLDIDYRKTGEAAWNHVTTITTDSISVVLSYDWDISLLDEGSYQVRFTAVDASRLSTEAVVNYTIKAYSVPVSPSDVTADTSEHRAIGLSWNYTGDAGLLTGYRVMRKSPDSANFTQVRFISEPTATSYTDMGLTIGAIYAYKIIAVDRWGAVAESAEVNATALSNDTEPPVAVIAIANLLVAKGSSVALSGAGSTDNDGIVSYIWDFGDGSTGSGKTASHTYTQDGLFDVTLTVSDAAGNTDFEIAVIEVVDLAAAQGVREITLNVVDSSTTDPLPGAEVRIVSTSGAADAPQDVTLTTDSSGTARAVLHDGNYSVQTVYNGYLMRTNGITVSAGSNSSVTVGMSRSNMLVGSLTATEMTYEEILAAGIDVDDPDNQHVFRFAVVLEFSPVEHLTFEIPMTYFVNNRGTVLHTFSGGGGGGGGGWFSFNFADWRVTVYPISKEVYLIIYGEATWLKEMFHVQLLLTNTSATDYIENVVAELELPDGLSLAKMLASADNQNTAVQSIDTIAEQSNATIDWYVRGDKEGEYNLTAIVKGTYMPNPEDFSVAFVTEKPIKVWAGSALHMYIEL